MATIALGKAGRPVNSYQRFLKEKSRELLFGSARVILAPPRLTRQESLGSLRNFHFAFAKPRFLQLLSPSRKTPSGPAAPYGRGRPPLRGGCHGCAMTGGVSFFTLHCPFGGSKGGDNHRRRSAANRSPLSLRTVLDAPHRGAGPEPAGETGVGAVAPSLRRKKQGCRWIRQPCSSLQA